jgi:hypothetical protein
MYDVVYINRTRRSTVVGSRLRRDSAVTVARHEARRRRAGRMFLAGSEPMDRRSVVLIVDSERAAA